ncbi:MAG: Hsp20/alpha crystallin family protein [Planctomycetia bacterium]
MPSFRAGFPLNIAPQFEELRDEIDRVWNSLTAAPPLHGWGARPAGGSFPAVNVHETDDCIVVEAELPGLDAGDVDIAVADDELVLKGARPECPTAEAGDGERKPAVTWHRRERGTGGFERRIPLPIAVDAGRVEARLVNGVLTVTCPKSPQCQPRKVEVRTS